MKTSNIEQQKDQQRSTHDDHAGGVDHASVEFEQAVRAKQARLTRELRTHYDFVVCGAGSSGSVIAARLAENPAIRVLLLEAGPSDDDPRVLTASRWPENLDSERSWGFSAEPNSALGGRALPLAMGRGLGGGSSINVMVWARGHASDWDYFAEQAGDPAWGYASVLDIYRRIEDWHGNPDPKYRGSGGPVFVQPAPDPNPLAPATVEAARTVGLPTFENANGRLMESNAGASIADIRVREGRRQSVFRSYAFPQMAGDSLTVLHGALVTRLLFDGKRCVGVELVHDGKTQRVRATREVVLSLGAIHTPKVLMQSGVGDEATLRRHSIGIVQHLPGVGQNFQDHIAFDCVWEYVEPIAPRNNLSEAIYFWKTDSRASSPDAWTCQCEIPKTTPENAAKFGVPAAGWSLFSGIAQPKSRGIIELTGPLPSDPLRIIANALTHPDDMKTALACVEMSREVGNALPLRPFAKREIMPGNLKGAALEEFIRNAAASFWHQSGTAKMGRDELAVVDAKLRVRGIEGLRVADASIMPRLPTGNTMATCVVIGERAADEIKAAHEI